MSLSRVTNIESIFASQSVLPIIQAPNIESGIQVAKAMQKGGLNVVEVVLRDSFALQLVSEIKRSLPELTVGVGTVYNTDLLDKAIRAGGDFIVTPATTPKLADALLNCGLPFLPGVSTLTDMVQMLELDIKMLKLFPAELAGGVKLLQSVSSLFVDLQFCPTGGVNATNFTDYIALPNVFAAGGTWVSPSSAVQNQQWEQITQLCADAVIQS